MPTTSLAVPLLLLATSPFAPHARAPGVLSLRPHSLSSQALSSQALSSPAVPHLRGVTRTDDVTSVPDGSGGQYVAWTDYRDGSADIYLLRVTNAGVPASGWPADGLAVCDAPGDQTDAALFPDGLTGVLVGWVDGRNDLLNGDVYAQHVNALGARLWQANGNKLLAGTPDLRSVAGAADGAGGLVLAWSKGYPNGDIYALAISSVGTPPLQWNPAGELVCSNPNDQYGVAVATDGAGGLVVAWTDDRQGTSEIWAQRLNTTRIGVWASNGIPIDTSPVAGAHDPQILPLLGANTIVIWSDYSGPVFGQRLNSLGAKQWNSGTPTTLHPGTGAGTPSGEFLSASDGAGGALVAWQSFNAGVEGLQAQRVSGAGAVQWGASGLSLLGIAGAHPDALDMVNDGAGGGFFAWSDTRNGTDDDVYVQNVTAAGVASWGANGAAASVFARQQSPTFVAPDGGGGIVVSWVDDRSQDLEIYSQRFNAAGAPQLTANGTATYVSPGQQYVAGIVQTSDGGTVVVWHEKRFGEYDIRSRKLDTVGLPTGIASLMTSAPGAQVIFGIIDTGDGCIVGWQDLATGKVMAQRLNGGGGAVWTAGGVEIAPGAIYQDVPQMIAYPGGGAVFAWTDGRNASPDIYAQRLDGTGARQWGASGFGVCTNAAVESNPLVAYDGNSGAYVVWNDQRVDPEEIYFQRLSAAAGENFAHDGSYEGNGAIAAAISVPPPSPPYNQVILLLKATIFDLGTLTLTNALSAQKLDITGGLPWASNATVCDASSITQFEHIISDGSGGAYVAWSDTRSGPTDIYALQVTSDGSPRWAANGAVVCNASGWQSLGGMTVVAGGDIMFVWEDQRGGQPDLYAQRLNSLGTAQLVANGIDLTPVTRGQYFPVVAPWKTAPLYVAWTDNRAGNVRYGYVDRFDMNLASQWTPSGITATTLALARVTADADRVRLAWYGSNDVIATVYRRTETTLWTAIGTANSDGTGLIEFEDVGIEPGTRYEYRLGVSEGGGEQFYGATWVDVPRVLALAIEGLRPNPAVRDLVVSFTVPRAGDASLVWIDAAGRRARFDRLTGLAAGRNVMRLEGRAPAPGLYFLKLTQGSQTVTKRATVLQ